VCDQHRGARHKNVFSTLKSHQRDEMARIESTFCLKLMLRVKKAVNQQTIKANACPSESVHRSTSASGEVNGSSLSYRIKIEFDFFFLNLILN
jgi:hypothetical protein